MKRKNGKPIVPRSQSNPVGQSRRVGKVTRVITKDLSVVRGWLLQRLKSIPTQRVPLANQSRYEYLIDLEVLRQLIEELKERMGVPGSETVQQAVKAAYQEGTARAATNLSGITEEYTRDVTSVLASSQYQARAALAGARVFEQMEGFARDTAAALARVIMQGVEEGKSPTKVAREIRTQFGVAKSRATRIARTEVIGALRRGRLDEADTAEQMFGFKIGMLWFSALADSTRKTHARRHGGTYTTSEVRDFYSRDGNAINCLCSQVEVVIEKGDDGVPDKVKQRTKRQKAKWQKEQQDA